MELDEQTIAPQVSTLENLRLSILAIIGVLLLTWVASVYSAYGISAYPRQEWLIESLASLIFLIPVVNLLRGSTSLSAAVRLVGLMLVVHTTWDALHWPGHSIIDTPMDPWIPRVAPLVELPLGLWLLLIGA